MTTTSMWCANDRHEDCSGSYLSEVGQRPCQCPCHTPSAEIPHPPSKGHSPMEIYSYGWACTDCIMWVANGETPPEMDEDETEKWVSSILTFLGPDLHVGYGGEHDDECPNMVNGEWSGHTDCDCETVDFSWQRCDVCDTHLGGSRHAVHFWKVGA